MEHASRRQGLNVDLSKILPALENVLPLIGGILAAILGYVGVVRVASIKSRTEIAPAIAAAFNTLTDQLQEEREAQAKIIAELRADLLRLERTIGINKGTIHRMRRHIESLERLLHRAELDVPPNPFAEEETTHGTN